MNKEFGHWDLLCDEPPTWESFVYLMIDTNGKMYIGAKTKTKKWQTYSSSSKYIKEAIASGIEFEYFILEFFNTKKEAFDAEEFHIVRNDAVRSDNFYNRSRAGKEFNRSGCHCTDELKQHFSAVLKGRPGHKHTDEHKEYMREIMTGRVISDESIEKMKKTKAENPTVISDETKEKMSKARKGKVKSKEHREAIAAAFDKKPPVKRVRTFSDDQAKPGRKGVNHHNFLGWWVCDGVEYESITEAAKVYGMSKRGIRYRCMTNILGWYFKPKDN